MVLSDVLDKLWKNAIAPSTTTAYNTAFRTFLQFLLMMGIITSVNFSEISVTEDMLVWFVAHCHNSGLSYSTTKLYLCGIRFMCIRHKIPYPCATNLSRVQAVLSGVKRVSHKGGKPRHPVTFEVLKKACGFLRINSTSFVDLMLETACTVAFFGFLRCGEFTVTSAFNSEHNLCVGDMTIADDCVLLHLKKSKTDPFHERVTLKLFKTDQVVYPYYICCRYMKARLQQTPSLHDPLFVTDITSGQPLSRTVFISRFRHVLDCLGIDSGSYNGHSFRIGAATSAAAAHIEDHLIKDLGRWSSDAYCRYIRTPQSSIKDAQIALTKT